MLLALNPEVRAAQRLARHYLPRSRRGYARRVGALAGRSRVPGGCAAGWAYALMEYGHVTPSTLLSAGLSLHAVDAAAIVAGRAVAAPPVNAQTLLLAADLSDVVNSVRVGV